MQVASVKIKPCRGFPLFLVSQALATAGDTFLSVVSVLYLFNKTGSGLQAGLGAVFPPLCGLLASIFAGHFGDRFSGKSMLLGTSIMKVILTLSLAFAGSATLFYVILFAISLVNVFNSVPARKLITEYLPRDKLLAGNSILNGLSGIALFAGPALAGMLADSFGYRFTMMAGGYLLALSSAIIPFLPGAREERFAGYRETFRVSIRKGVMYCLGNDAVKRTILVFTFLSFFSSATNLAFYPYAFETLRSGPAQWGLIISAFNGSAVLSSLLALFAGGTFKRSLRLPICICFFFMADAWFSYSLCLNFWGAVLLLVMEGTSYFLCVTLLTTKLQMESGQQVMARVLGMNDLASNAARLLGLGFTATMLTVSSASMIFMVCAVALAVFSAWGLIANHLVNRLKA